MTRGRRWGDAHEPPSPARFERRGKAVAPSSRALRVLRDPLAEPALLELTAVANFSDRCPLEKPGHVARAR